MGWTIEYYGESVEELVLGMPNGIFADYASIVQIMRQSGARQQIIIPPDIPIVIPAGFRRESRPAHRPDNRVAGFPPEACGNDGMPPCGSAWTIICCLAP